MKYYVLAVLVLATMAVAIDLGGSGQPGCKTDIEVHLGTFKNNWNPSQYWLCEEKGVAGSLVDCPIGSAYQNRRQGCVGWEEWTWEKPDILISKPDAE